MKLRPEWIRRDVATRLYGVDRPLIGLTGGIATGKTTVSHLLAAAGLGVINADLLVKEIYATEEALQFVRGNFPEVISDGGIDFRHLRQKVFSDADAKTKVEAFIYQRLPAAFKRAYDGCRSEVVIYDVPLLFERGMEEFFDVTVLVYAPRKIQRARLMKRDGLLEDMADRILDQQMDIELKRSKSDLVIDNSHTEEELRLEVQQFLRTILL